ncbi:MAG: pectin acetylesterase-family hydrolase [Polyangiales bacterium]
MSASFLLRASLALATAIGAVHCASGTPSPSEPADDPGDDGTQDDADGRPTGNRDAGSRDAGGKLDAKVPATNADAGNNPPRDTGTPSAADAGEDPGTPNTDQKPVIDDKYVKLDIAATTAFDKAKADKHPFDAPAINGWNWYNIDGAKCRDGSQFGVYVHWGEDPKKLFIYFEGGGACANPGFCTLNPKNVGEQFLSGGESAVASLFLLPAPQGPNGQGIFELANANNPVKGWSQVWIPYCTGDVYAGNKTNVTIEGVPEPQNFYGDANIKKVIGRMKATFPDITRFVAGGSSAGGYGAGIHFGNIQDTFREALGSALLDASPPFTNDYIPVCLQERWRDSWGVDSAFPSDCGEQCRSADGGNLFQIVDYWREKYPSAKVALISGIHDEIIRLFFSLGNDNCSNYQADPTSLFIGTLGDTYPPDKFKMGLDQLRMKYKESEQLGTYYMDGFPNSTAHQSLFRGRLYEKAAGADKPTIAEFLKTWIAGTMTQVGP